MFLFIFKMRGVIYRIYNTKGLQYFGSTKNFANRIKKHKSPANDCESRRVMADEWHAEILVEGEFAELSNLLELEAEFIKNNECVNKKLPFVEGREALKEKRRARYAKEEVYTCECGSKLKPHARGRHLLTKKHRDYSNPSF